VRPLKLLQVYSPRAQSRAAFAAKVEAQFGFAVEDCASVEAATAGAPVVTLVTRAQEPFLAAEYLTRGAHLNAVGAITPERVEFRQDVFDRTETVAVDSLDSVKRLSREFIDRYGARPEAWGEVRPISSLIAQGFVRGPNTDVTLFKAMGMGISDLALGVEILARAQREGAGRAIEHPEKAAPRLA
jgi:ornithine cyclodeaminase